MGNNRPVKTSDWVAFLIAHNCKYIRTVGSHAHYKCPNCLRTITFRPKDKDVPALHAKTNLRSMGHDLKYLYNWIEDYHKKK
jgi:predicted RNA binding protein YcfA (HicA-like mRNA interferase family)